MKAEVIGKPEKTFFNAALSHLNSITSSTETTSQIKKEGKNPNICVCEYFGRNLTCGSARGFID